MAPKPPLSGRVDMGLLRPPLRPSLLPSASWLPEGHLANVHINGLSAAMANSLISHNTAWNSAPRTVLREGTEVMGKYLGFKAHPLPQGLGSPATLPLPPIPSWHTPDRTLVSGPRSSPFGLCPCWLLGLTVQSWLSPSGLSSNAT